LNKGCLSWWPLRLRVGKDFLIELQLLALDLLNSDLPALPRFSRFQYFRIQQF